ncbi:MAG TPA: sn-glycerol-3-phosphate ABC transporter ATP-binding protein UgpC [Candidatus Borkfalkia stercoripullorum]|nr:sn-glycerol-3-phosphate ABC transporter ATP-binding protein UgpC [Candidatus Borkfalkia stercoripullorum]
MASLLLKGIYKVYPSGVTAVTDFNLDIKDKEFIVFVGPSGCGKSTTLRMIAGLEEISKGELYIDGKLVNDVVPKDRDIAMVFQNYALYPHMSVYDNMAFGLKLRKVPKQIIDERVKEAAAILGITDYLTRKPKALSGGQRQRVALGRAIVREPKVFLLDEPLSNLDAKLRAQMRTEISKLHARLATTFIYVTHDQVEAMTMGTRIVVMKDGFMQQVDTPQNLYDYPINQFVAGFIGTPQMNFFPAVLTQEKGKTYVEFTNNNKILLPKTVEARIKNPEDYINTGKPIVLGVRPEDIHDEENFIAASPDTVVKAFIEVLEKLGAETQIYCKLDYKEGETVENATDSIADSSYMVAKIDSRSLVNRGEVVELALDARHIHLFDGATEMSILARDEGYEVTPENESSSNFVPLTPQEMQAIIEKNRVVTKEEKKAMRREAHAAAKKERAEAKAAAEAAAASEAEEQPEEPSEAPSDDESKEE